MAITWQVAILFGFLGGFLIALVYAACVGSFLYLVEMMVRTSRVTLADFRRSFGMYLWDVIAVNFVLWILTTLSELALGNLPQGALILLCLRVLILVFFNAVPELIYLGHNTAVTLLAESYRFISENWLEWFPPNLVLTVGLALLWQIPLGGRLGQILLIAASALFLYFAMVVRGLLFLELSGSTRRGRLFRHKAGR
jgi:hypothetical protein